MNNFKFLFFLLQILNTSLLKAKQLDKECIFLNKEYSEGFLYLFKGFYTPLDYQSPKSFTDDLPTICDLTLSQCKKVTCKCVKGTCCHTDIIEGAQWVLKPVPEKTNTYFIQSKYHKKYFYVKKNYFGNFMSNLFNGHDTDFGSLYDIYDGAFMWELRKQPNGWFEVWNVKFNERNAF